MKSKENPQNWKEILANRMSDKGFIYPGYRDNSYISTIKRYSSWKMEKDQNRHFSRDM